MKVDAAKDACCRACLVQRRSLRPLYQRVGDYSYTYADLLRRCASVKVHANDGFSDKICLTCTRKAEEAYEFKKLVEQSDKTLWFSNNTSVTGSHTSTKKLSFDNVTEIKVEIDGCMENVPENTSSDIKEIEQDFKNGAEKIFYNNTSIKKTFNTGTSENPNTLIDVEEFLNTVVKKEIDGLNNDFAEDNFYEDDWVDRAENDDEYLPPGVNNKKFVVKTKYKKKKKVHKAGEKTSKRKEKFSEVAQNNVKLEPVLLDDTSLATAKENDGKKHVISKKGKEKIKPIVLEDYRLVREKCDFVNRKRKHKVATRRKDYQSICPYCGVVTKSIKTHLLIHTGERTAKCSECTKAFFTAKQLESHMLTHGERNYKCDQCMAAFHKKGLLQSHMTCHKKTKDMVCKFCSKAFKRRATLRRHEFRHSSANKAIKCEQCNMTFFEKSFLKHHMRVHTGERPFKCELCSQPYSYGRDFIRHCLKKHGCRFRGSEVRVMTEEVLLQRRAAQERRRGEETVRSVLPAAPPVDAAALACHQLDLQLKILNEELR